MADRIGLGIDTGGTYTDAVLYDFERGRTMFRAKSLTTRGNLIEGILGALRGLPGDTLKKAAPVSLSTTLATNACVEGGGCRAAIVLFGYHPKLLRELSGEYGLTQSGVMKLFDGGHSQRGEIVRPPDWQAVRAFAQTLKGEVEAIGVVEYWGIRNPEYEIEAKRIFREETGLPVVAAHEMTAEISSLRRAATTMLNARLIPLIAALIDSVESAMEECQIRAPLLIVRGDGSLMTKSWALEHPVETLLSGPAASVVGGMALGGEKDALVVDIGGTTTDLAIVRGGHTVLKQDGVDVGAWRTGTRAVGIRTIGLGGDSRISFDNKGLIVLGPDRATPLCMLSARYPEVIGALEELERENRWHSLSLAEFYFLQRSACDPDLTDREKSVLEALKDGPLTLLKLADRLRDKVYFLKLDRLLERSLIGRSALTPTDLMHLSGDFDRYDKRAAEAGARILANRLELTVENLSVRVFQIARQRLYKLIAEFLLDREYPNDNRPLDPRIEALGFYGPEGELSVRLLCGLPLIGIGAPTHIFLPEVARALSTGCVIPPDADVANAIGAITGSILSEQTVLIKPHYDAQGVNGYSCHGSGGYARFDGYGEALAWARQEAERAARLAVERMGAQDIQLEAETSESSGRAAGEGARELLLETRAVARAMGKPRLYR